MDLGSKLRLPATWLVLTVLTLVYLVLDDSVDRDHVVLPSTAVTVTAIVIALVKVRLIARQFMDVRRAPVLLGRLTDAWIAIVAVCLIGSQLLGTWLAAA
ncbi:cytochrome C oxidase subunit IV family protein [Nocardia sp. BSTN01]|uniref:cytochrome C oxidase subunit IV family protein n=1 Tax=Nocardia sp. BSTN01 TaxID=2783665 RepID=UPI00188FD28F|nr:cytochrome C oxidase subunit IV family protein [Nocardia sp. BSTN01]MBF4999622.1 cytochrome C oxidase subunit IV family protein [Nocardia sp. BSTN01]